MEGSRVPAGWPGRSEQHHACDGQLVVAQALLQERQLVPVLADWAPPPVPVHAVFASARYLTPKVRAFIDLAVEAIQASAEALPYYPSQ